MNIELSIILRLRLLQAQSDLRKGFSESLVNVMPVESVAFEVNVVTHIVPQFHKGK